MFDRAFKWYERMMDRLDPRLENIIMFLLGVLMIVYGIFVVYLRYVNSENFIDIYAISGLIIVIAGAAILFDPGRNYLRSIVLFAFSLGLHRFITYSALIIKSTSPESSIIPYSEILLPAFYLLFVFLGLLMMLSQAAIQMGFAFRRNSLYFTCIIAVMMSAFWMMGEQMFYDSIEYLGDIQFHYNLIEFVLFLFVIYIFDSDSVRNKSTWGKHSKIMYNVRNGRVSDKNQYIEPEVVSSLVDPTRTDWRTVMDCGPVEKEFSFEITGKYHTKSQFIIQIWKDDPRYHITQAGNLGTSLINANRFIADAIYVHGHRVYLSGKDGTQVSFAIRYGNPNDEFGYTVEGV